MKTPRDILLQRHRKAIPELDGIRRRVLATELAIDPALGTRRHERALHRETARLGLLAWRELILPCRRLWASLAVVWIVLLVHQQTTRDSAGPPRGAEASATVPGVFMTIEEQRQALLELTPVESGGAVRPAPLSQPGPRSESTRDWRMT